MDSPEGALLAAASRCDAQTLATILDEVPDIDVNYTDQNGMSPLMLCVSAKRAKANNQIQCVRLLLQRSIFLDSADMQYGRTAAHWAIANKNHTALAEILAAGANLQCLDTQQLNIVHLAVECNAVKCIKTIVSCLSSATNVLDEEDAEGMTPLVRATRLGNDGMVKQLLASGSSPSLATSVGEQRNAVHWAAVCGQVKALAMMLNAGGDVRSVDKNQWTVAHLAAVNADTSCLEVLLKSKSELVFEVADQDGLTPLMLACQHGHANHVKLLLKKKVSVLVADQMGRTALHHCVSAPNAKCVPVLVKHEPKLLQRSDGEGKTPLQLAAQEGSSLIADALLRTGDQISIKDEEGHSLVHWATVKGHPHVIQILAGHGADLSTGDANGAHPLHYAAQMSATLPTDPDEVQAAGQGLRMQECLRMLLQLKARVNAQDLDGRTPLHRAAGRQGNTTAVEMLIKHGADLNAEDVQQLTPTHMAASSGVFDTCRLLASQMQVAIDKPDENGRTALFFAVITGNQDIAELLMDFGALVEHQDIEGMSVAHCAAAVGLLSFLELLQTEAPHLLSKASFIGKTPLHEASVSGQSHCLEYLISAGCAAHCCLEDGTTPLHLAAEAGHYDCLLQLLEAHAVVNCISITEDFEHLTPLDCSILSGSDDACRELLLAHGGRPADTILTPAVVTIQRFARGFLARKQLQSSKTPVQEQERSEEIFSWKEPERPQSVPASAQSHASSTVTDDDVPTNQDQSHTSPMQHEETSTSKELVSSIGTLPIPSDDDMESSTEDEKEEEVASEKLEERSTPTEEQEKEVAGSVSISADKASPPSPSASPGEILSSQEASVEPMAERRQMHAQQQETEPVPVAHAQQDPGGHRDEELPEELVFSAIAAFQGGSASGFESKKPEESEAAHTRRTSRTESSLSEQPHKEPEVNSKEPEADKSMPVDDVKADTVLPAVTAPAAADSERKSSESALQSAGQRVRTFLSRTSSIIQPLAMYRANRRKSKASVTSQVGSSSPTAISFLCANTTATGCAIVGEQVGLLAVHTAQAIVVGTLEELLERQRAEALSSIVDEDEEGADWVSTSSSDTEDAKEVSKSVDDAPPPDDTNKPDASPSAEDVFRALEASRGPTLASQATQELIKTLGLQIKLQREIAEAELDSDKQRMLQEEELRRQTEEDETLRERQAIRQSLNRASSTAAQTSADMANAVKSAHKSNTLMDKQLGAVGSPKRPTVAQWLQSKEKARRAKAQSELLAWDKERQQRDTMLAVQKSLTEERQQRHLGWQKIKSLQADVRREGKRINDVQFSVSPDAELARKSLSPRRSPQRSKSSASASQLRSRSLSVEYPFAPKLPRVQQQRSLTSNASRVAATRKTEPTMTTSGFVRLPSSPPAPKSKPQRSPRKNTPGEQYGAEDLWELASKVASGRAEAPAVVDGRSLYPKKPATRHTGRRTLAFLPPDEYTELQRERREKEMLLELQRAGIRQIHGVSRKATSRASRSKPQSRAAFNQNEGKVTVMSKVLVDTESQLSV